MENTDVPIQNETTPTVVEPVTEETPTTTVSTSESNGEQPTTEETPVTENVEVELPPPTTTTTVGEITKPIDEQENVTDTNTTVPPASVSPGRANVPLKEVNESEEEEPVVITNGTENGISKKRELEQEDEQSEETTNNDERSGGDQTKKIKTSEVTDTPIIETKEPENNIIVNGNTAVEV